ASVVHPKSDLPLDVWVNDGQTISFAFQSPVDTAPASDKRYVLSNTPNGSSPYTVNGAAHTFTGTYDTQYKVSFAQTGIGSDTGHDALPTLASTAPPEGDLPLDVWVTDGQTISFAFQSPVDTAPASDKRYVLSNTPNGSSPYTVN